MLKVSLHYATPAQVSARNLLGRLDIAYARLDALADYKAVMFAAGVGEMPPVLLTGYPRWSASVWDLVARAVCLSLNGTEAFPPGDLTSERSGAFIDDMTAVIEHWPDGGDNRRATIGTAHISMCKRRCHYLAAFEDDILGKRESSVFIHRLDGLSPWDLLARAYAWTAGERLELPARPALYLPIPVQQGLGSFVPLDTVREPALTGIQRWLRRQGLPTTTTDLVVGPCVTEACFVDFLRVAV